MFSVITNIYNKKTKGPTLMELSTATGKLKKFFFWQLEMFDMCTTGDTAHIDTIFKLLPHTRQQRCDCGFESHRGHGCLSVVSVVCCHVEVSATDWSLVQRSPTDCDASLCVIKKPRTRGGYIPARGLQNTNSQLVEAPVEKKNYYI
jgi:hypothetical protein